MEKTDAETATPHFQHPQPQSNQPAFGQVANTTPDMSALTRQVDELSTSLGTQIQNHIHNGSDAKRINFNTDIVGLVEGTNLISPTIAATGNTDVYMIAPSSGQVVSVTFSGVDALATSDTNYITWTIIDLGQAGADSSAILTSGAGNTTKATGGIALSANTARSLIVSGVGIAQGDRLRIRAAVTGTLANTVTFPVYLVKMV